MFVKFKGEKHDIHKDIMKEHIINDGYEVKSELVFDIIKSKSDMKKLEE